MKDSGRKPSGPGRTVTLSDARAKLTELFDDIFNHDGHGNLKIKISFLRRGQKEILLCCGKEYRFVVDYPNIEQQTDTTGKEV